MTPEMKELGGSGDMLDAVSEGGFIVIHTPTHHIGRRTIVHSVACHTLAYGGDWARGVSGQKYWHVPPKSMLKMHLPRPRSVVKMAARVSGNPKARACCICI